MKAHALLSPGKAGKRAKRAKAAPRSEAGAAVFAAPDAHDLGRWCEAEKKERKKRSYTRNCALIRAIAVSPVLFFSISLW